MAKNTPAKAAAKIDSEVNSVGDVPKTTAPVPVSPVTAAWEWAKAVGVLVAVVEFVWILATDILPLIY